MKHDVVYLDVPFLEKDNAKQLGARWDQEERKWYVPKGLSLDEFTKWIEDDEKHVR